MRSWVSSRGGGFTSEEVGLLARRWVYLSRGGFTSEVVGLLPKPWNSFREGEFTCEEVGLLARRWVYFELELVCLLTDFIEEEKISQRNSDQYSQKHIPCFRTRRTSCDRLNF